MKRSPSIRDHKEKSRSVYGARGSLLPSEGPKFFVNFYFLFLVILANIMHTGTSQQM
jgi:hypothetical protein